MQATSILLSDPLLHPHPRAVSLNSKGADTMNAQATTINRAVPEWLETPEHEECEYLLAFQGAGGDQDHRVEMTRAEFDALKRRLAEMRGHDLSVAV